jgi:triacylglycerol lipase
MKKTILSTLIKGSFAAVAGLASALSYAHDPVIMIPGMTGVIQNMDTMQSYLNSHGWPSNILFEWTDSSSMEQDLAVAAQQLSTEVQTVLKQTGAKHVVLAGWSASPLAIRYYIKNLGGASYVSQVISFSGANHGTTDNACQVYVSCQEFSSPTTPFLSALNSGTEIPGSPPIKYLALRSVNDVNVLPTSSAELAGADNILLTGSNAPTHFSIVLNTTALQDMVNFILSNEPPVVNTGYTQMISATATNHYLAGRITVTQYNTLGAQYGYTAAISLYDCPSLNGWTNNSNCSPLN